MLASSEIIETVAETWRDLGLAGTMPFVVDPVCASMHGDPLLHPSALDTLRTELFPLATLVTPNLDEVRLLVGHRRDRLRIPSATPPGRCTRWARSGRWSRAAICGRRRTAPTCSSTAPTSTSSTRRGWTPAHDHGAGDTLARGHRLRTGARVLGARRGGVRQGLGHRVPARRLPARGRPRSGVRTVPAAGMSLERRSRASRTNRRAPRPGWWC